MEIIIHVEKRKLDSFYAQAIAEYAKRLSPFCKYKLITYKDFSKLSVKETSSLYLVVPGMHTLSSEELAACIENEGLSGQSRLEFIICEHGLYKAAKQLSISGFAMSCDLTAVVLTEQLYRAYTILNHITYHK